MKKLVSLFLTLAMVLSLSVTAFAEHSTLVTYTGTGRERYEITVPAQLSPSGSGSVAVSGTWATNRMLTVTAPDTVTLTCDYDGSENTLAVIFDGLATIGDNTVTVTDSETMSVGAISNALFGLWTGVINYTVSMNDAA